MKKLDIKRFCGLILGGSVLLFCYFCSSLDIWRYAAEESVAAYRPSAFVFSIEPILFGGIILVLPFCACLPTAYSDKKRLARLSPVRRLFASFVSGGAVVSLPFVIHTILWNFIAIPINTSAYEEHQLQLYGIIGTIYDSFYGIPVYLLFTGGMFLCGGVLAVVYDTFFCLHEDQIIAFLSPSLFYFGWMKISIQFPEIELPAPVDLFNEGLTVQGAVKLLVIYISIMVICFVTKFAFRKVDKKT